MDLARLGVLIWLLFPIPVYGISRYRRNRLIKKMPVTVPVRIVEILSRNPSMGDYDQGSTTFSYAFNVGGSEFTGRDTLAGMNHYPGEEITVRLDPDRPLEAIVDRPITARDWKLFGLLLLAFDLGYGAFAIFIGLLCVLAGVLIALRRTPMLQLTPLRRFIYSLLCILIGLPFIAIGIYGLISDGFLSQNILWLLWNHQTIDVT